MGTAIQSTIEEIDQIPDHRLYGRVDSVLGLVVEVAGLDRGLSVGERCRVIARNRFPAVDILRSVSRTMPDCNDEAENALVARARGLISTYESMVELIRIGAYKRGSDAAVDEAIDYYPRLEDFLRQDKASRAGLADGYAHLAQVLGLPDMPSNSPGSALEIDPAKDRQS